jgi:hypothetical protein
MDAYVQIELIHDDPSLLRVSASNGVFSGYSETYTNSASIVKFAKDLQGFPKDRLSEVVFESKPGAGNASSIYFRAFSTDGLGHCCLEVALKNDRWDDPADSVALFIQFEPAALDEFTSNLAKLDSEGTSSVKLRGVPRDA